MSEQTSEEEILDSIVEEMLAEPGEEVIEEVSQVPAEEQQEAVAEVVQEPETPQVEVQTQPLQQNELVPSKTDALLEQLVQQNQQLTEALQPREPEKELSDEDLALQELAQKLGLDEKLAEIETLKVQLQEQERFRQEQMEIQKQHLEMEAQAKEAMQVLGEIEKEFGVNETTLANKVDELIGQGLVPQERREDPTIWKLAAQNMKLTSAPQQTPDAMTSTQSSLPTKSATQERRAGKPVDDMAIVEEILNSMS